MQKNDANDENKVNHLPSNKLHKQRTETVKVKKKDDFFRKKKFDLFLSLKKNKNKLFKASVFENV